MKNRDTLNHKPVALITSSSRGIGFTIAEKGNWPFVTGESIHVDGGLLIPNY